MRKEIFLNELRYKLKGLPEKDIEDRISFYSEAIDDRIDEGKSEEEAVAELGSIDDIVNDIAKETPLVKLVKEKVTPKRSLNAWEIVLLVIGFPLWFPLVLTALILCLVAYLLIWVLVIVTYSVEMGLIGSSIWGLVAFFGYLSSGTFNPVPLGIFVMAGGAAILFIYACIGATKGTFVLSKNIITSIKASFIKKGSK